MCSIYWTTLGLLTLAELVAQGGRCETHVFNSGHDLHFRVDLLVQNSILHETSLLKLFSSERFAVQPSSRHIDDGECSPANDRAFTICLSAIPLPRLNCQES